MFRQGLTVFTIAWATCVPARGGDCPPPPRCGHHHHLAAPPRGPVVSTLAVAIRPDGARTEREAALREELRSTREQLRQRDERARRDKTREPEIEEQAITDKSKLEFCDKAKCAELDQRLMKLEGDVRAIREMIEDLKKVGAGPGATR